jgi:hypothetical protein
VTKVQGSGYKVQGLFNTSFFPLYLGPCTRSQLYIDSGPALLYIREVRMVQSAWKERRAVYESAY